MAEEGKRDLTEETFRQFVTRLAHDDAFRDALKRDPVATLEGAGISVDPDEVPETVELPPKERLTAEMDRRMEEAKRAYMVPQVHGLLGRPTCATPPKP